MIRMCNDFYYRVQLGDTEQGLINKFNTSHDGIIRNNSSINLYAGEWVRIKVNDYITHIVKPMETIAKISKKYNIGIDKIMADNSLTTDRLYIGQCIKIKKKCAN